MTEGDPVIVVGGVIGGLAAALALARRGLAVKVLEQSPAIGDIGAGVQLGPNAFAAFALPRCAGVAVRLAGGERPGAMRRRH
jgi:2-polyprenyl-6-methoxyphenol hydroxylase-like FAD-dependent oxidoreductase